MTPKKLVAILLFLLGAVEVFYGILLGRMRIYAYEASFARSMRLQELSSEQQAAHNHYIGLFQDQWHVVAWFGVLTVLAGATLWWMERKKG